MLFCLCNIFENKIDSHNYFFADIFGLYDYEYLKSSRFDAKLLYDGKFIWSSDWDDGSGEWRQEDYEIWKQKFKDIFKATDIHSFLRFENKEEIEMFDYLMKLFNEWFSQNSKKDMLNKFDKIVDLRNLRWYGE